MTTFEHCLSKYLILQTSTLNQVVYTQPVVEYHFVKFQCLLLEEVVGACQDSPPCWEDHVVTSTNVKILTGFCLQFCYNQCHPREDFVQSE